MILYAQAAYSEGEKSCPSVNKNPVVIFIEPTKEKIGLLQEKYGDGYNDLVSDAIFYRAKEVDFLEARNFPYCYSKNEAHLFALQGRNVSYTKLCDGWCMIYWDGKTDPVWNPENLSSQKLFSDQPYLVLKPGSSANDFKFLSDGSVYFKGRLIYKFKVMDVAFELHISPSSPVRGYFFVMLWDTDKGGMGGLIVDGKAGGVIASLTRENKNFTQIVGEEIRWSPIEGFAVIPERGEVQRHVNLIDLIRGDVFSVDIGNLTQNKCQLQYIDKRNGSWLNDETYLFQVAFENMPVEWREGGVVCNEKAKYPAYQMSVNARTRQISRGVLKPKISPAKSQTDNFDASIAHTANSVGHKLDGQTKGAIAAHEYLLPIKGAGIQLITEAGGISTDSSAKMTPCGQSEPYDDPCHHSNESFYALDFDALDAVVVAAGQGEIVYVSGPSEPYQRVIINHGGGYFSEYAEFTIKRGLSRGQVKAGTELGVLTGKKKEHLHFQVKYDPDGNGLRKGYSKNDISQLADVTIAGRHIAEYKLKRSKTDFVKIQGVKQPRPLETKLSSLNQTVSRPVVVGPDVKALAQPPTQLIQIDLCLLYKCEGHYKAKKKLAVLAAPDVASKRIGSIDAGTKFDALSAALVTHTPTVLKVKERWAATENTKYWFEPGDLIYVYANWGEGCHTVWTSGYLYGYTDTALTFGGNIGFRKDLIGCIMIDPDSPLVESIQKGSSSLWVKSKSNNSSEGWVLFEEGSIDYVE